MGLPRGGWGRRKRGGVENRVGKRRETRTSSFERPTPIASPLAAWWSWASLSSAVVGPSAGPSEHGLLCRTSLSSLVASVHVTLGGLYSGSIDCNTTLKSRGWRWVEGPSSGPWAGTTPPRRDAGESIQCVWCLFSVPSTPFSSSSSTRFLPFLCLCRVASASSCRLLRSSA